MFFQIVLTKDKLKIWKYKCHFSDRFSGARDTTFIGSQMIEFPNLKVLKTPFLPQLRKFAIDERHWKKLRSFEKFQ